MKSKVQYPHSISRTCLAQEFGLVFLRVLNKADHKNMLKKRSTKVSGSWKRVAALRWGSNSCKSTYQPWGHLQLRVSQFFLMQCNDFLMRISYVLDSIYQVWHGLHIVRVHITTVWRTGLLPRSWAFGPGAYNEMLKCILEGLAWPKIFQNGFSAVQVLKISTFSRWKTSHMQ